MFSNFFSCYQKNHKVNNITRLLGFKAINYAFRFNTNNVKFYVECVLQDTVCTLLTITHQMFCLSEVFILRYSDQLLVCKFLLLRKISVDKLIKNARILSFIQLFVTSAVYAYLRSYLHIKQLFSAVTNRSVVFLISCSHQALVVLLTRLANIITTQPQHT